MQIIDFLSIFFKEKGWYITFFGILSWILLLVLFIVLILQVLLLIFRVRYNDEEFINAMNEMERDKNI